MTSVVCWCTHGCYRVLFWQLQGVVTNDEVLVLLLSDLNEYWLECNCVSCV
jgi:hypothetical protein